VFALKRDTPLVCAVEQVANYLENLNVKIIIKVESHDLDEVTHAFEGTEIKDRVMLILFCIIFHCYFILQLSIILRLFYYSPLKDKLILFLLQLLKVLFDWQ
jgi:hypothetical protein